MNLYYLCLLPFPMPAAVQIQETTMNIAIYVFGFLFTSLVGIIIFLARTLMNKVDTIKLNQEAGIIEYTSMKKDVSSLLQDLQVLKTGFNDIQRVKEDIIRNTKDIEGLQRLMEEYHTMCKENNKQILELGRLLLNKNTIQ